MDEDTLEIAAAVVDDVIGNGDGDADHDGAEVRQRKGGGDEALEPGAFKERRRRMRKGTGVASEDPANNGSDNTDGGDNDDDAESGMGGRRKRGKYSGMALGDAHKSSGATTSNRRSVFDRMSRESRPFTQRPRSLRKFTRTGGDLRSLMNRENKAGKYLFDCDVSAVAISAALPDSHATPHPAVEYQRAKLVREMIDAIADICQRELGMLPQKSFIERWFLNMVTTTPADEDPLLTNPRSLVESEAIKDQLKYDIPYRITSYALSNYRIGIRALREYVKRARYWLDATQEGSTAAPRATATADADVDVDEDARGASEEGGPDADPSHAKEGGDGDHNGEGKQAVIADIPSDIRGKIEAELYDVEWWLDEGDVRDGNLLKIHLRRLRDQCTPLFNIIVSDKISATCEMLLEIARATQQKMVDFETQLLTAEVADGVDVDAYVQAFVGAEVEVTQSVDWEYTMAFGDDVITITRDCYEKMRKLFVLNKQKQTRLGNGNTRQEGGEGEAAEEVAITPLATGPVGGHELSDEDMASFHAALYCVLRRYTTFMGGLPYLPGAIFELSLPPTLFHALNSTLGVSFELCASPMNAFFANYCSPFPDTDSAFNSAGSLACQILHSGSFQCHPASTELAISRAVFGITQLMDASEPVQVEAAAPGNGTGTPEVSADIADSTDGADGADGQQATTGNGGDDVVDGRNDHVLPLSVVFIAPDWTEPPCESLESLKTNRHTRLWFVAPQSEHAYVSGTAWYAGESNDVMSAGSTAHGDAETASPSTASSSSKYTKGSSFYSSFGGQRPKVDTKRKSLIPRFGTRVYIVQNSAGAKKWPLTDAVVARVKRAFGAN